MFKVLLMAATGFWAFILGMSVINDTYRTPLIQHGYGQYCPTDGHFASKGDVTHV